MADLQTQTTLFTAPAKSDAAAGLVRVPGWAHIAWLVAGFSTRAPGSSQAYGPDEQNLGWTAEDDPLLVARNRQRFLEVVAGPSNPVLCTIKQIHSGAVHDLEQSLRERTTTAEGPVLEGDGLITTHPGRLLGILTADCVPVLLADTRTRAVAAFHAGWRGTLAGIVQGGAETLHRRYGSRSQDLVAAIGPSIRPCCFHVGEEVQAKFLAAFPYAAELFSRPEATHDRSGGRLDLQEANRRQLLKAGLADGQIATIAECTACCRHPDRARKYFSYRAEGGRTGRMLSVIGVC